MATYKKRGYKPKTKIDRQAEIEAQSTTAEVFNTLDEGASKTEEWVVKNQRNIFIAVGLIAVIVLGSLGYKKFIQDPKESNAMNDMFKAQQYFEQALTGSEKDSLYNLALHGGEGKYGMLDIVNEYGGTDAANLANYYAGMAFLNIQDYENAIKHLSDFSSDDEALGPLATGAIGDAFVQLNQPEDGLEYYEKAFGMKTNEFTTPLFLYKAGTVALQLEENSKALDYFTRIKEEFDGSKEAINIDIFIGKAQAASN